MVRTDLGIATAYAEAVSKGYTGTRDEFGQMFVDFGKTAEKVTEDKKAVEQMKASVEETKDSVDTTASEFGQNVADKTEEAKAAITEHANTEKASATAAISEAKDAATGAITEAQTSATDAIAAVKDSATAEITKKGTETLATIPEDYTTLSKDVSSIKEDLSTKITKFYASNQGKTHIVDSDNGKIQDMMLYGKSSQFTTTGKNLANGQNINCFINSVANTCGISTDDIGMVIDVSKLTNVSISTRSIQDRYRFACANTVPTKGNAITCYNGTNKDGTKDSYTMDTTGYNYLFINATKLEDIQVEKGSESTSYEPYTGGIPSPSPDYPQEIKSVVNPVVKVSNEDGTKSQTVTLPYTLNAIPVSNGGNVTIGGQQYIADYVDVERGKIVRMCKRQTVNTKNGRVDEEYRLAINTELVSKSGNKECIFSAFKWGSWETCVNASYIYIKNIKKSNNELYTAQELKELSLDFDVIYQLSEQQETDLTTEQTRALKELVTYYPVTNISVNSERLDGYAVFNYPISMKNGWNYVKQQLNDNRDYIYDMDLQSAESYVNSEYAVALTELEV